MSEGSTGRVPEFKRSGFMAGAANGLCPGLGFLYLGMPATAVGFHLLLYVILFIGGWSGAVFLPLGYPILLVLLFGLWLFSMAYVAWKARCRPPATPARSQRWYFYALFFVASVVLTSVAVENRSFIFGYETFSISDRSMRNTLQPGDHLASDPRAYRRATPQRGDLVIFESPADDAALYIQRVLGLPGEQVEIRDGKLRINGVELREPYVRLSGDIHFRTPMAVMTVPDSHYLVLADNRNKGADSRVFGPVSHTSLRGQARIIVFSSSSDEGIRTDRIGQRLDQAQPTLMP